MMPAKTNTKKLLAELYTEHFSNFELASESQNLQTALLISAPGRIELAGNHTDHQGGRTISSAVDLRAYALAVPTNTDEVCVYMDGYGKAALRLSELDARESEKGTPLSIIRGMAAAYAQNGGTLHGFNMVTCSDIPVGRGLSSSAAFEMLVGAAIRAICCPASQKTAWDPTELALEGVWVEQTYFGKPCGAQDQLASAFGGVIAIDFSSKTPLVTPIDLDINAHPYSFVLIDSQCDHSLYNDEFASIPSDMFAVAQHFGYTRLEDLPYATFLEQLQSTRIQLGDRKALRALHYFEETQRVLLQQQELQKGNFEAFLRLVRLSGVSSAQYLQNVSPHFDGSGTDQSAMIILALCAHLLDNELFEDWNIFEPAYRIHGGGFGGSVLAFVPEHNTGRFVASMNKLLGYEACSWAPLGARGTYAERFI